MNAKPFVADPAPVVRVELGRPAAALVILLVGLALPAAAAKNGAPSVSDLELETSEELRVEGALAATDPDGDALSFKLSRKAAHGEVTVDRATGALGYTPAKDHAGEDVFSVEVSDGKLAARAEVRVRVSPVNDPPVARPVKLTTNEDAATQGASSASDVDGDALTYRVSTPPAHGTATVDPATGALTYEPAADSHGPDAFVVEVTDGTLAVPFEVGVTVAAVNDAPVAASGSYSLDEDGRLQGTLTAPDVDGDAVSFRVTKRPGRGELQLDEKTGVFTYVPARDAHGAERFTFQASDGKLKSEATVSLEVRAVNDAPTASPLSLATSEDVAARGAILASDADRDVLTWKLSGPPAHGTAEVEASSGTVAYQPAPDFHGTDGFTVEVTDGALTATAAVTVAVAAVNDAPVLAEASFTLDEDGRLAETLVASDVDGDSLIYKLAGKPTHGAATLEPATGKLGYTPAKDHAGDDALSVEVSDGKLRATAAVRLQVRAVNDAPVARPLSLATREDTAVRGTVVASDVDGTLKFRVSAAASHGEARVDEAGAVSYQPAPDFHGADVFTVEVSDGELTASSEVTVAIAAVNDAPLVPELAFTLPEDTQLAERVPFSDVDGDALSAKLVVRPTHGVATIEPQSGALGYRPARDFHGEDTLSVEVSDGKSRTTALVTLHVTPVNDAPVAGPLVLSTSEDTPARGTASASDVDREPLTWRVATPPGKGEASVDARTGAVTYRPAADANGPDSFVLEVSDGALTANSVVSVAVAAIDDPPLVRPGILETSEDTAAEGKLPGSEADGERLKFRILSTSRLGTALLLDAATGAWRFTPGPDLHGDDELAFDVSDGKTTTAGVVKLLVKPVNDPPVLPGVALSTLEDRAVEGLLVGTDVDGDRLTYAVARAPSSGRAVVPDAGTGKVRFEPARDFHGEASFTVVASDGKLQSAPAAVTVTVSPQNDPPVAAGGKVTLDEDEVLRGTLGATDVDGEPLVFRISSPPAHGTLVLADPVKGVFSYTPVANYSGEDGFGFTATDPSGATAGAAMALTIRPVNDPPVGVTDSISAPFRGLITGRLKGYDREGRAVTFRIVERPARGQFRLVDESTGEFTYASDGSGTDLATVRFEAFDGALWSEPAELVIRIRSR